jgi:CheY-like chemotaxis protein
MKKLSVLIVDAHRETADRLAQWVVEAGHSAYMAPKEAPDAAVLDVAEWEFATSLLQANPSLLVAIATDSPCPAEKQRSIDAGFRLYLRKPVRRRTLMRMLAEGVAKERLILRESSDSVAITKIRSRALATHICSRFRQDGVGARVDVLLEVKEYQVTIVGLNVDGVRGMLNDLRVNVRA